MKIKTVLIVFLLVITLGSAYFAYSFLTRNYKSEESSSIGNNSSESVISTDISSTSNSTSSQATKSTTNPAPDFTVTDARGNTVKLSDFIGKPVVLNFWASWCPPCKGEMPHFNNVYAKYQNDVVFMMVDLVDGQRETQAKGQEYAEGQGYTFPVYFDNKQSASDAYNILYIPTTILIDANGDIVKKYDGAIDEETLVAGIQSIQD